MLRRALKAGSSSPREATRTALTTAASTFGNASSKVRWFWDCGEMGRGGFGGGSSSAASFVKAGAASSVAAEGAAVCELPTTSRAGEATLGGVVCER